VKFQSFLSDVWISLCQCRRSWHSNAQSSRILTPCYQTGLMRTATPATGTASSAPLRRAPSSHCKQLRRPPTPRSHSRSLCFVLGTQLAAGQYQQPAFFFAGYLSRQEKRRFICLSFESVRLGVQVNSCLVLNHHRWPVSACANSSKDVVWDLPVRCYSVFSRFGSHFTGTAQQHFVLAYQVKIFF